MIRKFLLPILFVAAFVTDAFAKSEWEGVWEYGRYAPAYGGFMEIRDCRLNVCRFAIQTFHGAHTCDVKGKIKVDGTKAVFYKFMQYEDNEEEQKIVMKLNPEKRIIDVDWQNGRSFCGSQGNIGGAYEYKGNPLRYATSYDCWAENLTDSEKAICGSEKLAKADREFAKDYPQKITYAWKKERNTCGADENCLWKFYTESIFAEYKAAHDGNFSLYQYFLSHEPEWYFPTDYVLLQDYLENNITPEDYEAWKVTLYDKGLTARCKENCSFMSYGLTGFETIYESSFYIDEDGIWVAFVSGNLPEEQQKKIVVYAPSGKTEWNMSPQMKDWLLKMVKDHPDGTELKYLERPKLKVIKRNWYKKPIGETYVDVPEPYAPIIKR